MSIFKVRYLLISLPFVIGLLFFIGQSTVGEEEFDISTDKQKGTHLFGLDDTTGFQFLHRNHIEWVTLVPWGFQTRYDSPRVSHHNGDSTNIKSGNSSWLQYQKVMRSAGFKLFIKPHVWINETEDGKWRSDIFPTSAENWEVWKASYQDFILRYARLAQAGGAEMFCIGTEFSRLSTEKPNFWKALIQEVRQVYKGKITYAANWYEEYERITFWEDLDYIGIQAYFPLAEEEFPSVKQVSDGWNAYLPTMKNLARQHNRKIIFTEIGYKSTSDSAITPWEWLDYPESGKVFSAETQANCYAAFFEKVWPKKWFEGVHIWQMRSDYLHREPRNLDFTPLQKTAESVIAKGFE